MTEFYETLLEQVKEAAKYDDNIRCVILIGSQARTDVPADEYSDIDLIFILRDKSPMLTNDDWISRLGEIKLSFSEPTICGGVERRVFFDQGRDADFILLDEENYANLDDLKVLMGRAYSIVVDKDSYTDYFAGIVTKEEIRPVMEEKEFNNLVNTFYFHIIWAMKKTLRGEIWASIICTDGYLKELFLQMLEQYETAQKGDDFDTWHAGRFVEEWADKNIVHEFSKIYAEYSINSIYNALYNSMILFTDIARQTAEKLKYTFPDKEESYTADWMKKIGEKI